MSSRFLRGPIDGKLTDVLVVENVVENNVDCCQFLQHAQLLFHKATNGNDPKFVITTISAKNIHVTTPFNVVVNMAISPTCIIVVQ